MKSKKNLFIRISFCMIIIIAIVAGGFITTQIYAYLTDADEVTNQIVIGGSNIEIVENFRPPKEVVPGISFEKNVKIKNCGPSDCYVRVKAVFSDSDMGQYCEVDWNRTDWIYDDKDGYYYYSNAIKEEEHTVSLFTTITMKEDTPKEEIKDFEIIVYAESYQSEGFYTYVEAWESYNKNKPK